MMTPTRIVRLLGFVGLAAFIGLVATSTPTIRAQNEDRLPPPPPPIAGEPLKPVIVSQATEEPAPAPKPAPAAAAIEPLPLPAPAEPPAAKPAAPVVDAGEPKAKAPELPPIAENADAAPIPHAPEPKGLEAAAFEAEPQPIGEAAPAKSTAVAPDDIAAGFADRTAPEQAPIASDDPDKQARSFVERNRKEAEAQLKALNTEAAQLRARLSKIESGIRRWQALADAMERTEDAAVSSSPGDDLEPLPRAKATSTRRAGKAAVIHSTPDEPVARKEYGREVGDHMFHSIPAEPEADPVTRAEFVPAPQPR